MKRLIFAVMVLAFAFTIGVYAEITPNMSLAKEIQKKSQVQQTNQMTNSEIQEMISRSKEANLKVGVTDPNLILPGQTLTFLFKDGKEVQLTVEPGDNQWSIIKYKLIYWESVHGPVVNYSQPTNPPDTTHQVRPIAPVVTYSSVDWGKVAEVLMWIVFWLAIVVAIVMAIILFKRKYYKRVNPVTAGTPQVPGGVSDANARQRMQAIASSRYPSANIVIKNIRRGRLSGHADVFYAGKKRPKKIRLNNAFAYAGEVTVNGILETIYFLQGCGNDARVGNYMKGKNDLVFTPDVAINQDGHEVPITQPVPVAETQPASVAPIPDNSTEYHQQVKETEATVREFLSGNDAKHRVHIIITPKSYEATIENKYDQSPKKAASVPSAEVKPKTNGEEK
jgi:hypothetical protein